METTLPAAAEDTSPGIELPGRTDGLASMLAQEHGADLGTKNTPPSPSEPVKRPGRPPIHGLYSQAAGSDGKHPVTPPGSEEFPPSQVETPAVERVTIPSDMLSEVINQALAVAETYAQTKIEGAAALAGLQVHEIQPQLEQARISEARKDLLARLVPLAFEEWGMNPAMSPTAAIALLLVPTVIGATSAYMALAKLAREYQARRISTGENDKDRGN